MQSSMIKQDTRDRKRFDDVVVESGGFGRFQILFIFIVAPTTLMGTAHILSMIFCFGTPSFGCASLFSQNMTYGPVSGFFNVTISRDSDGKWAHSKTQKCETNRSTDIRLSNETSRGTITPSASDAGDREICTEWVYDTSDYTSTIVSELNLVCERNILVAHAQMLFFAGNLIGSLVMGVLSDNLGRTRCLTLCVALIASSGIGIAFSPNLPVLMTMLFFNGMSVVGLFLNGFVFIVEITTPDKRVRPCMLFNLSGSVGAMCCLAFAYWFRAWRSLQLAVSVPCFAFLLIFAWWLPESGRWLLSKGRVKQAEREVLKMARYNGVTLPSGFHLQDVVLDKKERGDWKRVIKSRTLCKNIAIICLNWFAVSIAFYGITLNAVNLSGNRFVNVFAMFALEIPAILILYFIPDRVGRKRVHCVTLSFGGVSLIASLFPTLYADDSLQVLVVVLVILGRLLIVQSFITVFYLTTEMFPTHIRGIVIGLASMCARVASMMAPYINDLGVNIDEKYGQALPVVLFGAITVVAGLLSLCLPKTDNEHLPDSVRDGEIMGHSDVRVGMDTCEDSGL